MKKVEIVAKEKGVEIGRKTVEMPETLDEAVKLEGSKELVLGIYINAKKVALRASLYTKTPSTRQKSVYDKAIAQGCSKSQASSISGYTPPMTPTPVK